MPSFSKKIDSLRQVEAMIKMQLQKPQIFETDHSVIIIIKHERLADAETLVLEYMDTHETISNSEARELTGISDANKMKRVFNRLKAQKKLEIVPGTRSTSTRWRQTLESDDAKTDDSNHQISFLT